MAEIDVLVPETDIVSGTANEQLRCPEVASCCVSRPVLSLASRLDGFRRCGRRPLSHPEEHRALDAPVHAPRRSPPRGSPCRMAFASRLFAAEPDVQQPIAIATDARGRPVGRRELHLLRRQTEPRPVASRPRRDPGRHGPRRQARQANCFLGQGTKTDERRSRLRRRVGPVSAAAPVHPRRQRRRHPRRRTRSSSSTAGKGTPPATTSSTAFGGARTAGSTAVRGFSRSSNVGRPGCAPAERAPMTCGVWRYHPTLEKFEAFCHGTTNPRGMDCGRERRTVLH